MTTAATPIELDLRRDLPKVRAALDQLLSEEGSCKYTTPCAIGVMMSPEQRGPLAVARASTLLADETCIGALVENGIVSLPSDQCLDAQRLQDCFDDRGRREELLPIVLAELEAKYLGAAS